ncbi:MAG TPA: hypothetical protein VET90_09940, partial [Candidatus Binatus sp.]|nr:hypothetical protein [Candidatus Binatus sp.]
MPIVPPPRLSEEGIRRYPAGVSGLTPTELESWVVERGEAPFRARQVLDALWRSDVERAADVTTLPGPLRAALAPELRW